MSRLRGQSRRERRRLPRLSQIAPSVTVPGLRVPDMDWSAAIVGTKREIRSYGPRNRDEQVEQEGPLVLWQPEPYDKPQLRFTAAIRERVYCEPLGAISAESLELEGFDSFNEFRDYFQIRYPKRGFRPLDIVRVVRFRPWEDDEDLAKDWLLGRALPWLADE